MTSAQLSELSDSLFSAAIIIYALAALAFCAELAFGRRASRTSPELAAVGAAMSPDSGGDGSQSPAEPASSAGRRWGLLGVGLTGIGALANAGVLVARSAATGRVPWGNIYEFGTAAVLAYLVFALRVPAVRRIGVFVFGPVVIGLVLIGLYLYAESGPLIAALRSDWLAVHVSAAIISFGIFIVSAVASALSSWRSTGRSRRRTANSGAAGWPTSCRVLPCSTGWRTAPPSSVSPLDLRGDRRRDLGGERLGAVLGLGPERNLGLHLLGPLRRLPARPNHRRLARPARCVGEHGRFRNPGLQPALREPRLDRSPLLGRLLLRAGPGNRHRRADQAIRRSPLSDRDN